VTWVVPENMTSATICPDGVTRARVLAYAVGEEKFDDDDSDGYFSVNDVFDERGEPFLDENGDGNYTEGEFFVDWNNNGTRDATTGVKSWPTDSTNLYNGTACVANEGNPPPDVGLDCSNDTIFVFDDADPTL
ncbi:MAG: hypothetical protein L7T24_10720, partial [Luminiphilus sp.]|nr:hypothetical protein [Luminiphilus sp.]